MSDQGRLIVVSLVGAAVGAAIGFLYLTENGRRIRRQLEPRLDEAAREIGRLRHTLLKAQEVASAGWRSLDQLAGGQHSYDGPRQSEPF